MKTVEQRWNLRCPSCRTDDRLTVIGTCNLKFTGEGVELDGGYSWDSHAELTCGCGFSSQAQDFKIKPPEPKPAFMDPALQAVIDAVVAYHENLRGIKK